jgi:PEP-CTERM motif
MNLKQLFAIGAIAATSSSAHAVVQLGNPFTPSGANFQITAVQGIDASNPFGKTGFSPQVNHDFEFQGSTGVSYDAGGGKLTDFGLGLYNGPGNTVQSTGLRIDYTAPVNASSIVVTLEDFDIHAGKDTSFNPGKVEPTVILFGANNTIFAQANPTDIFKAMSPAFPGDKKNDDVWNLNFDQLLKNLNIADGQISGFLLGADMAAGEKPNSDPYLLIAVGNGIPAVPEPGTYAAGLFGIGIAVASVLRSLKRRVG